jgi:hypothetical protein
MNSCSSCYGINSGSSSICSGHGQCVSTNNCSCVSDYTGYNSQLNICYGINQISSNVCSGHSNCQSPDNRVCRRLFEGSKCEKSKLRYLGLLVLLIPITILAAIMIILFIWLFKRGYLEIKRIEKRERELSSGTLFYVN